MDAQSVLNAALAALVAEMFQEKYVPTSWSEGEAEEWLIRIAQGAILGVTLSVCQTHWVPCLN